MSEIRCIIIEDEPLAVKVLADYISQISFLELQGSFKDAILATEFLHSNEIDLIFLDIHLPKLKGMDFIKTLKTQPSIIVTTAYHQYAVEGFQLNVTDYLLKPIEFDRFLIAVNRVPRKSKPELVPKDEFKNYFFITAQKKKVKILFDQICYIESQKEYVKIVTQSKDYIAKMSTKEIEEMLPTNLFKRIHRSFIIALDKIESFNAEMVEIKEVNIPIGRGYKGIIEKSL
ncbi:MAG: LytTR family DNA-binding domain-containing protein [Saprospiraceae bacterium]|nr:response regulator transcription factor [Saprospiraceae bacterium]